jgi:hypothetical protein
MQVNRHAVGGNYFEFASPPSRHLDVPNQGQRFSICSAADD